MPLLRQSCSYLGETIAATASLFARPRGFRFRDFVLAFQRASCEALPVASGIGLLLGVILAFESAAALKAFGAEVYVSDMLAIGLFRELGPLVTAIVLAGRTGSAFAAEIATMKTNEELDALTVMGLDPVRFLVPPRVLAALLAMPLITIAAELAGLAGGAAVLEMMGVPQAVFWERTASAAGAFTVALGLAKSALFGLLAGLVGCGAGILAKPTADGAGRAATGAVVGGMIAIAIADGILAVLCHVWDV